MPPRSVARSGKWSPSFALCACRATTSLTSSLLCAHASSPSRALRWPTHMKYTCVSRSSTTRLSSKRAGVVLEHPSSPHSPSVSRPSLSAVRPLLLCSTRSYRLSRRDAEDRHHWRSARTAPRSDYASHLRGPRYGRGTRPCGARSSRA
jgi:hypothetical protein